MATELPDIGDIADRPTQISGCIAEFSETTLPNVIRNTSDDNQTIFVRRRTTAETRTAQCSVMVPMDEVPYWRDWFSTACQGGVLPTYFNIPGSGEEVWRFSGPLSYDWTIGDNGKHIVKVSFTIEKLPQYTP